MISERSSPMRLRARQLGLVAARALREPACGSVSAVFARSVYVGLGGAQICIGARSMGSGPLHLVLDADDWPPAPLRAGDAARADRGVLRIGDAIAVSLAGAPRWAPAVPGAWNAQSLARGRAAFRAALPDTLPTEGLALLLRAPQPVDLGGALGAAHAPAGYLAALVRRAAAGQAEHAAAAPLAPLIGLGPGLTPSGDDFLGGALIALAQVGQSRLRDVLWAQLAPLAEAGTSAISRAHLAAAAEGFGSAALHALLEAVLECRHERMRASVDALAALGHTSGWDALAGAMTVLDAISSDQSPAPSAAPERVLNVRALT